MRGSVVVINLDCYSFAFAVSGVTLAISGIEMPENLIPSLRSAFRTGKIAYCCPDKPVTVILIVESVVKPEFFELSHLAAPGA